MVDRRDFFISFNSVDGAYAEAIDTALRAEGFTTFFHPNDLPPGGNVPAWMEEALLNSNQTLALFSPDYIKDSAIYSFAERYASWWQDARGDERRLIPIVLREIDFKKHLLIAMLSRIDVAGLLPKEAASEVTKKLKAPKEAKSRDAMQIGSHLPKIFRVAYRPNPHFAGRFEDLDSLQKSLRTGNAAITAVAGIGGVGKTTLAAEYCHRFGGHYAGVWWIRAEQESVMLSDIVELGAYLKLEQSGNIEKDTRACLDHLTTLEQSWLLVYDNAPNADTISRWLPAGIVRCIVTSRRGDFDSIAKITRLDQWSIETTADYLLSRTERDDKSGAERLARALGGLPLATEQAAAFLRTRKGITFADYIDDIARLIKTHKPAGAKGDYPDTVYAALVKSLETLGHLEDGETALGILRLCAFLSPDGIDLTLLALVGATEGVPSSFSAAMADKFSRENALASLIAFSLLRQEEGPAGPLLIFHRLLLDVTRDWIGDKQRVLWGGASSKLISNTFPIKFAEEPGRWPICSRLIPHVASLDACAPRTGEAGEALDSVLGCAGIYLKVRGDLEGALSLLERAVALKRITRKSEELILAICLNDLGGVYIDLDRLDDAEVTYREALAIEEKLLDPGSPVLMVTLSNFARLHWSRKDYEEAARLLLRTAEVAKTTYGPESVKYGLRLLNLGAVYDEWGEATNDESRRKIAEQYKSQSAIIVSARNGLRHPMTAQAHKNLAVLKYRRREIEQAITECEKAVAIMFSLGLTESFLTRDYAQHLILFCYEAGENDRAARLARGDISDLIPIIVQIEAEHRAWVAEDPENRSFGPPSPLTDSIS
ncbi:MAG TPA: tetratricopeptide repeat protein [Rhizomicrobium sp.]|jgi:tetratricopeptide (TPR) repeat protein